jgi:hypothetical protein
MSSLQVDYERAAPAGAALGPADEFVEFWQAGAVARVLFCCVGCGRRLVSAYEEWSRDDLNGGGRFIRGVAYALVVGPAIWLGLASLAFLFFALVHG